MNGSRLDRQAVTVRCGSPNASTCDVRVPERIPPLVTLAKGGTRGGIRRTPRCGVHARGTAGFTLLEVLLALSLSLVLIAALYAAVQLHVRMAQKGPEAVRRVQAARAVLARIARDIRATVPKAAAPAASDAAGSAGESSGSSSGSAAAASDANASGGSATISGLWGGTDWIELIITEQRPNLDAIDLAASSGQVHQAANVHRVTYALAPVSGPVAAATAHRVGVARSELSAVTSEQADAFSDETRFRAASDFLCDDAGHLEFQYWDETLGSWTSSWGTAGPAAPPRAVKVSLSLLSFDEYLRYQAGGDTASAWTPNYELVVPVPVWQPDSATSTATGATP